MAKHQSSLLAFWNRPTKRTKIDTPSNDKGALKNNVFFALIFSVLYICNVQLNRQVWPAGCIVHKAKLCVPS